MCSDAEVVPLFPNQKKKKKKQEENQSEGRRKILRGREITENEIYGAQI